MTDQEKLLPPPIRFHALARAAILCQSLTTVLLGWFSPGSLTARIIDAGGDVAHAVLIGMTGAALLGLLDLIVNDWMPAGFKIPLLRRNRNIGYMLLGGCYLVQAFASITSLPPGSAILIANYTCTGLLCGVFAAAASLRPHHAL